MEFAHNHINGMIDCNDIARFPTTDAEPVRHGRWINPRLNKYGHPCHQCNQCLFVASQKDRNYCPDCGAKMDLKE
jgi:ribosomal protein S27AE